MSHPEPKFIVLECFVRLILRIVLQLVADFIYSKNNGGMCKAAAKQQVELNQFVKSWIAYYFAVRGCEHLVVEDEHIGAQDVNIGILIKEIHLHLKAFRYAYVIGIHSCNEICTHFKSHLNTCVESLGQPSILWKSQDCNELVILLSELVQILDYSCISRSIVDNDQVNRTFIGLLCSHTLNGLLYIRRF